MTSLRHHMLCLSLLLLFGAPAVAQDAEWVPRTVDAAGGNNKAACGKARLAAAADARAHLGLNIKECGCPEAAKGERRCTLHYEILVRKGR